MCHRQDPIVLSDVVLQCDEFIGLLFRGAVCGTQQRDSACAKPLHHRTVILETGDTRWLKTFPQMPKLRITPEMYFEFRLFG